MMSRLQDRALLGMLAIAVAALTGTAPAAAQSDAEFFRGKSIAIGIPSEAGGGYDNYVRLLARHYSRHLPGNPNIVPQNMPGGGGLVQATRLFNTEPANGLHMGMVRASVLYEAVFGNPAAKLDGRQFGWIGNLNSDRDTCVFWHTAGIDSPADFYTREVLVGATGTGSMSYSFPSLYNEILGTKFERGEIHGGCGLFLATFKTTFEQQYRDGKLKLAAIGALSPDPEFPAARNLLDEAKTPEQRQALEFLFAQMEISRALAVPPNTPPARVDIMRQGFDATIADGEFRADAAKLKLEIGPISGPATAAVVDKFYVTPDAIVQRVRKALGSDTK